MATVLSIVALCLSVASLTWQVTSFLLTGARIKVSAAYALPVGGLDRLPECMSITARNVGRFATTVRTVGLEVRPDGTQAVISHQFIRQLSTDIPHRLEPGDEASWFVPLDVVRSISADHPAKGWAVFVTLGTGKRVRGRRGKVPR
ncbi:hypothetical protein GCM10027039_01830 [Terrabacter koreensis]